MRSVCIASEGRFYCPVQALRQTRLGHSLPDRLRSGYRIPESCCPSFLGITKKTAKNAWQKGYEGGTGHEAEQMPDPSRS